MLFDEEVLTLPQAAACLPRIGGKKLHASTVWRWARRGLHGIRLETRRVGGRMVTSKRALEDFTKTLANLPPEERPSAPVSVLPPRMRAERQRQRDIAKAEAELKAAGV